MLATEFIRKKRFKEEHSFEELEEFISGYVNGTIPDYQVSSWLMAVCLNGMSAQESAHFTKVMLNSGKTLTWTPKNKFLPTDKHSTGGIGDKASLIIAPLVASFGVSVPMMAGRGLGFTGGTLDKLESIPGFQTRISLQQFEQQMARIGMGLIGQTDEICPADKKMYALRDVTSTVESIPLICASILSKKIAEGAKVLVMDVKYGSGAFMPTIQEARLLAQALIQIGALGGLKTTALLTDMNQPLGRYVGNALEVQECLEIMRGQLHPLYIDTISLSIELSAHMLLLSGYESNLNTARQLCHENLNNGKALKKFEELIAAQGGNLKSFDVGCREQKEILAVEDGYVSFLSNKDIGLSALWLGGGRQTHTDQIDPQVGIEVLIKHGNKVKKGDPLFRMHINSITNVETATNHLIKSFHIQDSPPTPLTLIHEVLT